MEKNRDIVYISPSEFRDTTGTCSNTAKPCLQGIKNFFQSLQVQVGSAYLSPRYSSWYHSLDILFTWKIFSSLFSLSRCIALTLSASILCTLAISSMQFFTCFLDLSLKSHTATFRWQERYLLKDFILRLMCLKQKWYKHQAGNWNPLRNNL